MGSKWDNARLIQVWNLDHLYIYFFLKIPKQYSTVFKRSLAMHGIRLISKIYQCNSIVIFIQLKGFNL